MTNIFRTKIEILINVVLRTVLGIKTPIRKIRFKSPIRSKKFNVNKAIIGQININSISSKFNQLKELVLKHVDILVVCEAKLDETFPNSQLHMDGFSLPYRLDKNCNGGGVMIFVKGYIPSKMFVC